MTWLARKHMYVVAMVCLGGMILSARQAAAQGRDAIQSMFGGTDLKGRKAVPVRAEQWLNAPVGMQELTFGDGKVYLLEFTSYTCKACISTYEPLKELVKEYGSRLNVVLVTNLGHDTAWTRTEELAYDKRFFLEEHKIPFPIAVSGDTAIARGQRSKTEHLNWYHYGVSGEPKIVMVDGKGIIHYNRTGYWSDFKQSVESAIKEIEGSSTGTQK